MVPQNRGTSSINGNTDFTPGVERFLESGDVVDNGEASRLNGTDDSGSSYAMYRVSLQDSQPGVVSIDANLLGSGSEYYVGVSNYGTSRWDWQGPFSDSHVRLPVVTDGSGDYTSEFGNSFVSVLINSGSSLDVVGVGINQYDLADASAPAAPSGLAVAPVNGGLELTWSPVLENDVAGYAIHFSERSFINPQSAGVRSVPYLEGSTRHILTGISEITFVRITAVDFSSNGSAPTELVSALPLAGDAAAIELTTDTVSTSVNGTVNLSASGADSYDWDLDGDGVFEVTDDATGSQSADTSATGIIRPRVRASDTGGTSVALGGLSLIITGNTRPVASAVADPQSGSTPLAVTYSGFAEDIEDGEALTYAWDFDGDGIYEPDTDTTNPAAHTFLSPGLFNSRFYVEDTEEAWSVASLAILATGEDHSQPLASFSADPPEGSYNTDISLDASGSRAAQGETITQYAWDLDGDGTFETDAGTDPLHELNIPEPGYYDIGLRVTDSGGQQATVDITYTVHGWRTKLVQAGTVDDKTGYFPSLAVVAGQPAIVHYTIDPYNVIFSRAGDPLGVEEDWTILNLAFQGSFVCNQDSLSEINGNPAIAFTDVTSLDLLYARSSSSTGELLTDWTTVTVDFADDVGYNPSLAVIDGNPAIAYEDMTNKSLKYARSTSSNGMSPLDWTQIVTVDTDYAKYPSLAEINGRPAVSYSEIDIDAVKYARSSSTDGALPGDWADHVVMDSADSQISYAAGLGLREISGRPCLTYVEGVNGRLFFARALQAEPGNFNDWNSVYIDGELNHRVGFYGNLSVLDGKPIIGYLDNELDALGLARSSTLQGNHPSAWNDVSVTEFDAPNPAPCNFAVINGHPAFAFSTSFSAWYAILF